MGVLKREYGPGELKVLLEQCGFEGSIAVQASQTEEENAYLLSLSKRNAIIKGIVGWIDLQSNAVSERLSYYKSQELIKGFRHVIHDEPDVDFMLRPSFLRGIEQVGRFGYTYDLLIFPIHLANTIELARRFPDQLFVVDHIAKPGIRNGEIEGWKISMSVLASFENVYCKISGMVTEADWKNWRQEDFIPYLDTIVELFGTTRIMYGSDWPVCTLAGSYADTYGIVKGYFDRCSAAERDDFYGLNAARAYRL